MNFEKYLPMIKSRAAAWHKMTGIDIKEFESLGGYLFARIQAENSYNPDKSSFSTYFYQTLNGNFQQYAKTVKKMNSMETSIENHDFISEHSDCCNAENLLIFQEIIDGLSNDAKEVCRIIFESPNDLIDMILNRDGHKRISKRTLEIYFHEVKKWTINRFRDSVLEIKQTLQI